MVFLLHLLIVEMVQTKCTPKNPQIHQPIAAIAKDIQLP